MMPLIQYRKSPPAARNERTKLRFGFKSKKQLPWFIIWREYWRGSEVVYAHIIFKVL